MNRTTIGGTFLTAVAAAVLVTSCGTPGSSTASTTSAPAATSAGSAASGSAPATSPGGSAAGTSSEAVATGDPVKVGIVTSLSGPLQSYGQIYLDAFNVGLDFATDGTGAVNGRPIEIGAARTFSNQTTADSIIEGAGLSDCDNGPL